MKYLLFQLSSLQVFILIVLWLCFLVHWIFFFFKYEMCYSPNLLHLEASVMIVLCCQFYIFHICFSVSEGGTYPCVLTPTLLSSLDCFQLIRFILFSFKWVIFSFSSYVLRFWLDGRHFVNFILLCIFFLIPMDTSWVSFCDAVVEKQCDPFRSFFQNVRWHHSSVSLVQFPVLR